MRIAVVAKHVVNELRILKIEYWRDGQGVLVTEPRVAHDVRLNNLVEGRWKIRVKAMYKRRKKKKWRRWRMQMCINHEFVLFYIHGF